MNLHNPSRLLNEWRGGSVGKFKGFVGFFGGSVEKFGGC